MMWSGVMIKMVQSMLLRINEISNALYVAIVLFLAVLIIPDDGGFHLPLLAFITVAWPIYFVYLRAKKHTVIAINSSILFWLYLLADVISYEVSALAIIAYMFFIIAFSFLFVLVYQEIGTRVRLVASASIILMSAILYAIPVLYIVYYLNFGAYVTPEIVYAIMQTNVDEAMEFIHDYVAYKWFFLILISSMILSYYLYKVEKQDKHKISILLSVGFFLCSLTIALFDKGNLRIVYMLTRTISHYGEELEYFKQVQERRRLGEFSFDASKLSQGETYIVAIGESLNKHHMSLYGYVRNTTPALDVKRDNNELLVYENAYSNHVHTMPALSQFFTEANQKNNKDYYDSLSIIDILKKAGVETHWVSNQIMQGVDDNLVGVIATQVDQLYRINHNFGASSDTQKYDGDMIEIVNDIVSQSNGRNRVIFVHLMGNHGDYCSRYPRQYHQFDEPLEKEKFGLIAEQDDLRKAVNCYDNSVLYNDYVVSSLIDIISSNDDVAGLIYLPDHADDVLKKRGHNSGLFTYSMTEIPLLMWFSDAYKDRYSEKFNQLQLRQKDYFSNDLIYDTLIGIFEINTSHVERKHDLSSSQYAFDPELSYTLHGKKALTGMENYNYWLLTNQQAISRLGISNRVIPHRVNSTGKLSQVLNDGISAFEFDLMFVDEGSGGHLIIGHDSKTRSSTTLDEFLKLVPMDKIKKMWFDVKNANPDNIHKISKHLQLLDVSYGLKEKIIFESEMTSDVFNIISDAGFHTSYYLPGDLARLYRKNELDELKKRVDKLLDQLVKQRCSAVSFDVSLYPFVKGYLEKHLDVNIVYHTWDLSMELKNPEFIEILQQQAYFKDNRIKTILVRYYSDYDL